MCLFEIPHLYGAKDCLVAIPDGIADTIKADVNFMKEIPHCDEDVQNLCNCIGSENGYVKDYDPYNAVNLYIKLRTEVGHLLKNINP
ncbi:hypothetical protein JTB14_027840 [Gonioctena quinquepunctata]|nr:hypothetical protein JTB14_027840 [Gonioctena quinquepunctata]